MKTYVKKLDNYPVTVTDGVYVSDSNTSIHKLLESQTLKNIVDRKSDKLLRFRGEWVSESTSDTDKRVGDWWLYTADVRTRVVKLYLGVAEPNCIIYYGDDGWYHEIYVPYDNTNVIGKKYDVCIVGGGAGGIGAAYALRNSGWRVCIVDKLDTLGGTHCNAGVGLLIASPICGWYKNLAESWYSRGLLDFYRQNGKAQVGDGSAFEKEFRASQFTDPKNIWNGFVGNHTTISDTRISNIYYDDFKDSIDIFTNWKVTNAVSDDGELLYLDVENVLTGQKNTINADYFLDCSGDGVLFTTNSSLERGVDYFVGTDGRSRFGETVYSSSEQPNEYGINTVEPMYYMIGYTDYATTPIPNPTQYKTFSDVVARANFSFSSLGDYKISSVSNSYGTKMSLERFVELPDTWNQGDGYDRALATFMVSGYKGSNRFGGTRKLTAIREKFRAYCESTVDQTSLLTCITSNNYASEHTIALSTWYVDIHNQGYSCTSNIANGIPYEAMIPRCYTNVLAASRCYGASHIGLSSIRLVKTMMDLGHSAGTAVKQLLDSGTRGDVRTVNVANVQTAIGIADVITELETYFYQNSVSFTTV